MHAPSALSWRKVRLRILTLALSGGASPSHARRLNAWALQEVNPNLAEIEFWLAQGSAAGSR